VGEMLENINLFKKNHKKETSIKLEVSFGF